MIPDYQPVSSLDELTPEEIISLARRGRVVDERDGLPLFRKFRACRGRKVILFVDAIDDEPYISSQLGPLLHLRQACAAGAALAQKAVAAKEVRVQVYKNVTDLDIKIPKTLEGLRIERIGGVYPAESHTPSSMVRHGDSSYLYVGACALIHLYRAVYQGRVQTTTFVTVAGNCVDRSANLEVPLGMTATQLLEDCGFLAEPTRIVVGGPMTGVSVADTDQVTVNPMTRAILAFREDHRDEQYVCIGCGRCSDVCPSGLNPMLIYRMLETGRTRGLEQTDYHLCIGCMSCSYQCPAKLDLAQQIFTIAQRKEAVL